MYAGPTFGEDGLMQDTSTASRTSTHQPLRRSHGPVGGVLSGIGNKVGVDANLLRIATVLAAIISGPLVLVAYLAAWMLIPVDERLPANQRPTSAPRALIYVVGAIIAIQFVFGVLTSLPIGWMLLAGVAIYWFFIKD